MFDPFHPDNGCFVLLFDFFSEQGLPIVAVSALSGGAFTVQVCNGHSSAALAGILKIHFNLLQMA